MKKISIFGSSGSIGKNAIEVLMNDRESFEVVALIVNNNAECLIQQAKLVNPRYAVIANESLYDEVKEGLSGNGNVIVLAGSDAVDEIAKIKCDMFISAIVGLAALRPTFNAIEAGSNIGLANKECLVAAGDVMLEAAKKSGVKLVPIDSEHNAIFQVFENGNLGLIDSVTLTASGGPFFKSSVEEMKNITKEQALKHPKWVMGRKITIDSATMMNKALEMIEAHRLFDVKSEKIEVVIHPQSIVHGMVNYVDGSTLAMLSVPDMKVPISYAIGYPDRMKIEHKKLDLAKIGSLEFFNADEERFVALKLARKALSLGGNAPCVLNAANEVTVEAFLNDKISFSDIVKINMEVLEKTSYHEITSIEDVLRFDQEARLMACNLFSS
jgi:1-deoxy-D-xylulose-5-phosphate reductoisomerase